VHRIHVRVFRHIKQLSETSELQTANQRTIGFQSLHLQTRE
jgi:hypothetical protein